jgi:hypothetical protein
MIKLAIKLALLGIGFAAVLAATAAAQASYPYYYPGYSYSPYSYPAYSIDRARAPRG